MRTLTVRQTIGVAAPLGTALAVVRDLETLECCEPKIDALELHPLGAERGIFRAHGRLLGKRWSGAFRYQLLDDGFDSVETAPNCTGLKARGGFRVAAAGAHSSRITHYEQYTLPLWALPMKQALAWYIGRSVARELQSLARLILEHDAAVAA